MMIHGVSIRALLWMLSNLSHDLCGTFWGSPLGWLGLLPMWGKLKLESSADPDMTSFIDLVEANLFIQTMCHSLQWSAWMNPYPFSVMNIMSQNLWNYFMLLKCESYEYCFEWVPNTEKFRDDWSYVVFSYLGWHTEVFEGIQVLAKVTRPRPCHPHASPKCFQVSPRPDKCINSHCFGLWPVRKECVKFEERCGCALCSCCGFIH